jgi:hypothetical protein
MLRFADDIAVITDNEEDLQNSLEIMNSTMKNEYNMKINKAKTKFLVCSRNEGIQTQIALDGDTLEQVNVYKYLRSTITEDGRSTREIISRINQVKCAFQSKKNMFISRNIDIKMRKNLLKTYVWSVALYGNEIWTTHKTEEKRLLAFEA